MSEEERNNALISEIKKLKGSFADGMCYGDHTGCDGSCLDGYNFALDEVIKLIQSRSEATELADISEQSKEIKKEAFKLPS